MILFAILFLGAFAEYIKVLLLSCDLAFALTHIFILQTAPSGTLPSKIYPLRMAFTSMSDIFEFISRPFCRA